MSEPAGRLLSAMGAACQRWGREPWWTACPTCGAAPEEKCHDQRSRNQFGRPMENRHALRSILEDHRRTSVEPA